VWPWEHLAVAYLAVSLLARARGRRVTAASAAALALGSQFPDLVDKPLAWSLAVLPSGTTLAHSVFVAVPLSVAAVVLGRYRGVGHLAVAFAVAYLLHLPADAVYGTVTVGSPPAWGSLLWPLVEATSEAGSDGLLAEALHFLRRYRAFLARPEALVYILLEVGLLLSALGLWVRDGRPGVREVRAALGRARGQ
jgi:hypothetical protein